MTAPGWYKDRDNELLARWHDGEGFTEHTIVMAEHSTPPPPPVQRMEPAFGAASMPPTPVAPPSRQETKADAAAAQARSKAMRPWFKKKRFVLPLIVIGIAVAASAANSTGDTKVNVGDNPGTSASVDDKTDDVTITNCKVEFKIATVGLTIVNNSSDTSNYLISLTVEDADGAKVGDGVATADNLAPGQTAKIDGIATVSDAAGTGLRCKVDDVQRYASP